MGKMSPEFVVDRPEVIKLLLKRVVPARIRRRLRYRWPRWPLPLVPWLPGSSRYFGPPRRWQRLTEYFAHRAGHLREVLPAQALRAPRPEVIGEIPPRFLQNVHTSVPPGHVFTVAGARLLGPAGWVVTADDTFLMDAGFEANDATTPLADYRIFRTRRGLPPRLRRLPGRCLSLASDFTIGGFGHFIHDSLTRLLLIEQAGLRLQEFDWIYLSHPDSPAARQLVAKLGIPPGRLLNFDPECDLWCQELTATGFPGMPGHIAAVYAEFLRRRFSLIPRRSDRRLYLSRRGFRRNFENAEAIEDILHQYGFEEVLAHEDPDTLQKCAEAALVFSIEGASFFNAAFCPAGTRVLVVVPDRLPHNVPYALTLAEACGFPTFLMSGTTVGPPGIDGGVANFHLDPDKLRHGLKRLGAE